jgi:hypothetical protein
MLDNVTDQFQHISNGILRHILRSDPKHLKTLYVQQAVEITLNALGRDVIDPSVPATALEQRIKAASEARKAIDRRQRSKAHSALRKFWSA